MAESRLKRWTVADVEALPDDEWTRYEIVDGELLVSSAPRNEHQEACAEIVWHLGIWNRQTGLGTVLPAPGVIFGETDAVIPDVVWLTRARRSATEGADGHLHGPPELAVEVLSPGAANERRDREAKRALYARRGVDEYWIVDPAARAVAVYRQRASELPLVATLGRGDTLTSPLLPGFALPFARLFVA